MIDVHNGCVKTKDQSLYPIYDSTNVATNQSDVVYMQNRMKVYHFVSISHQLAISES